MKPEKEIEKEQDDLPEYDEERAEFEAWWRREKHVAEILQMEEERDKRLRRMFGDDYYQYVIEYVFD